MKARDTPMPIPTLASVERPALLWLDCEAETAAAPSPCGAAVGVEVPFNDEAMVAREE